MNEENERKREGKIDLCMKERKDRGRTGRKDG